MSNPMVSISTPTRFWAFRLASRLHQREQLSSMFTGCYPSSRLNGLPVDRVERYWPIAVSIMLKRTFMAEAASGVHWFFREKYDRWVSNRIRDCDVFWGFSGCSLYSFRAAKERGILTICDRGSAHSEYWKNLLKEEQSKYGLPQERPYETRILERHLKEYEESDLIVVPSTYVYNSFVEMGVSGNKVAVNPFGVNLSMFRHLPKEDNIFRVLYVGRINLNKGILYLLEALAHLDLPNFELVLLGGLQDEIRPLLKKYQGSFRHIGAVPQAQLKEYYSQSSVFVLPSISEGFGLVLAEAMACGLPVIATTNSGAEDLITDGVEGFIVPIRDPDAIREKVLKLYEDPNLRTEMAQAAMNRVKDIKGWDSYYERSVEILQNVYETRKGA